MKLETERLILRKPRKSDIQEVLDLYDINISKNHFMPHPFKKEHAEGFVKNALKRWGKGYYEFVVERKKDKAIVGMVGAKKINETNGTCHISSWIGTNFRNKYYATEAKIKLNDFLFNELKLKKIKSEVATFNKKSNNMQKKFGLVFEGKARKEYLNPYLGKNVDMNIYGLLKPEWKKIAPKLKRELKSKISNFQKL